MKKYPVHYDGIDFTVKVKFKRTSSDYSYSMGYDVSLFIENHGIVKYIKRFSKWKSVFITDGAFKNLYGESYVKMISSVVKQQCDYYIEKIETERLQEKELDNWDGVID